ncbi:DUF2235 domain-containing protein [Vibrio sp. CAU 1672]|uniref:phospholipase effector Tle1 domain-containing protein n=1 Tax=Vibrio sp. CAU 1672 TaxID=3032594 RepID=UPI0023DBD055|nr:DUF2235 domain-containing protein [Vibrio sp. CAU 1672]MDF2155026.1 DUF2235 domain-containing protein [Vibrio sp. CAU 1672]
MARLFIFNFDGTCNAPDDAEQEVQANGRIEDNSITNTLKFHLLCGGSLARQGLGWEGSNQHCYYFAGVGTYGNALQKTWNAMFSPEGCDVRHILRRALSEFSQINFDPDKDIMLITGFSRGAALARRFAKLISDQVDKRCIYEAVFDTVASISAPNLSKRDRPQSEVVFEDHSLPENVIAALHLVSLDDKRRAFQPTLMNHEDKVTEVWFPGAHADVGGGYQKDGLSDVAMRFYLNWIERAPFSVDVRSAKEIDYATVLPEGIDYSIGIDDITINPNSLGENHQQDRWLLFDWLTLCDRLCCVIENDKVSTQHQPIVHWSVAERIYHDQDYRPNSLKQVKHQLIYQDFEQVPCSGIQQHIELPQQRLTVLAPDESKTITVYAAEKYNRSGVFLEAGRTYQFSVADDEQWYDASIACSAAGWDRADVELGLKEVAITTLEPFRRVAGADWFTLCASIGSQDKELFEIGLSAQYTPATSGELCPFANDLERFYGNNRGSIRCTVTRLE